MQQIHEAVSLFRVATGPGKPGKPWNFVLKNSRPWKVLENALGPGKSWNSDLQVLENPGILNFGLQVQLFLLTQIVDISNMGESALKSHAKGSKHIIRVGQSQDARFSVRDFMQPVGTLSACDSNAGTVPVSASFSLAAACVTPTTATPLINYAITHSADSTLTTGKTVTGTDTLSAEVLWALKCCVSHYSYKSCSDAGAIFQKMFPDSKIAQSFTLGKTKCSYILKFGIAPYVKSLLVQSVKDSGDYVLMFDESLNRITQEKQMDVWVRYWANGKIVSRYLTSEFMGHASAEDMLRKLESASSCLNSKGLLQLSMDGPNVNWKLFNLLQRDIEETCDVKMLNIGSCGLHQLHNAFRAGSDASDWAIEKFLSSIYWLFKDTPARREDFVAETGSSIFPLKFCSRRWVENAKVCQRAIELYPQLQQYITAVNSKKYTNPKTKSFTIVSEGVKDPLMLPKLTCFLSVAKQIEPFLVSFQTDSPMVPFLYGDLLKVVRSLMERFVKQNVLKNCKDPVRLDLDNGENICEYSKVDIGFSAQKQVKELVAAKKVSERQAMQFRMESKAFFITVVKKLCEKSPLKYGIVKSMAAFDPQKMADVKMRDRNKARITALIEKLVEANRVKERDADRLIGEYMSFIDEYVVQHHSKFSNFNHTSVSKTDTVDLTENENRTDVLLCECMARNSCYSNLWSIVRILLLLSHGQATVERGFSVNKEVESQNLAEETFTAQHLVCDHINAARCRESKLNIMLMLPINLFWSYVQMLVINT